MDPRALRPNHPVRIVIHRDSAKRIKKGPDLAKESSHQISSLSFAKARENLEFQLCVSVGEREGGHPIVVETMSEKACGHSFARYKFLAKLMPRVRDQPGKQR